MKRRKLIILSLLISLYFPFLAFAEAIILKSGKAVEGRLIEKTDKYIKIDFQGVVLTYFLDEIERIEGEKPVALSSDKNVNIKVTFDSLSMAIGWYEAAVKQNPNDFAAYIQLGLAYAQLNQYQKAIENLQKSIQINPDFAESYAMLGATYNSLKQPEKAIPYLKKAIELGSTDIRTYFTLGWSYYFTGKFLEAIPYLEKVVQLDPKQIKAYIAIGSAYKSVGNYQKAKENFLKLKELYEEQGDHQAVQDAEELLKGISIR